MENLRYLKDNEYFSWVSLARQTKETWQYRHHRQWCVFHGKPWPRQIIAVQIVITVRHQTWKWRKILSRILSCLSRFKWVNYILKGVVEEEAVANWSKRDFLLNTHYFCLLHKLLLMTGNLSVNPQAQLYMC